MEKISNKKGGYFRENNSQLSLIIETLNNVNKQFDELVPNLQKQNSKLTTKISEFNTAIEGLDPEKDIKLIKSIEKKIMTLNKTYLNNEKRISDLDKYTDEDKVRFMSEQLFQKVPVQPKDAVKKNMADMAKPDVIQPGPPPRPVPGSKNQPTIPKPRNSQQVTEIKETLTLFLNKTKSQKTLLNNYLSDKKLI